MDAARILEGLEEARRVIHARNKCIGEPAVEVDPSTLLVATKGEIQIHMRIDHLIGLVSKILD